MHFQTSSTIRELKEHSICQGYQIWTSSVQSRPVSWVEQIPKKAMEQENDVLMWYALVSNEKQQSLKEII